ncbi:protein of unknown function (plasmid) [Rhodovastum atsumiense]|uniref:DUF4214 domain-containing protein n=1 Tax=Rhodovastum atsumiense TaxID=504468 RepID=UPI002025AC95|nr:DUF4214 domain-containing protein [Rhodovastum atsumiense]CAH2605511.1 protein of unknown function [Rhodovastum atsumiense]
MPTLDLSKYTEVFHEDFESITGIDRSKFPKIWGNSSDFSFTKGAVTLTSRASEGWANVGFMTSVSGGSNGWMYGLFQVTASLQAGEGVGPCIVLWPNDDVWPGPEIDLLERIDNTTGYYTVHWKGSDGKDKYSYQTFSLDLTQPHTYAVDWQPGSLTYYIDGVQLFHTTQHVPTQAEAFGVEVTAAGSKPVSSSVSMTVYDMSVSQLRLGTSPMTFAAPLTTMIPAGLGSYGTAADGETVLATAGDHSFVLSGNNQIARAVGGAANITASGNAARITTGNANDTITVSGTGSAIDAGAGINTIHDNGSGTIITLPAAGKGVDRIFGAEFTNGAVFDLRMALADVGWGGEMTNLAQYLTVRPINGGADLQVAIMLGNWTGIATLYGHGQQTMAAFLQHAILSGTSPAAAGVGPIAPGTTTPPAAPSNTAAASLVVAKSNDWTGRTASATSLRGTSSPNATITVTRNGAALGTATADVSGQWNVDLSNVTGAAHVVITSQAAAGNTAVASLSLDVLGLGTPMDGIVKIGMTSRDLGTQLRNGTTLLYGTGTGTIRLADGDFSLGTSTTPAFVARLYQSLLGRTADANGMAVWSNALGQQPPGTVTNAFINSAEYAARHGTQSDSTSIAGLYHDVLGRDGEADGMQTWIGALASGISRGDVAAAFVSSGEAQQHWADLTSQGLFAYDLDAEVVREVYKTGLGREAEAGAIGTWGNALHQGMSLTDFCTAISNSGEFQGRHAAQSDSAYVASLYQDGLGRTIDPAGGACWTGMLASGMSRGSLLMAIATSQECRQNLDWAL